ncbi:murein hydrolase activator EnvC family protein [Hoeflea prorocentri]|uniref:Murein hydrolase activator EnvC n=1 Tax=Hoeflea prorocentri TaxID=1922333 RepID=A0A9X3UMQ0_9HYPH|nr:murein hydrolase activator EnvC [Hoeflea prorocentri]MCY6383454.1 murein hydrolase activator EnvC [Hoeflea prorocentri]MDA5401254.1 murein hydrolase activator EnvC [Hoeflea prorocentri]
MQSNLPKPATGKRDGSARRSAGFAVPGGWVAAIALCTVIALPLFAAAQTSKTPKSARPGAATIEQLDEQRKKGLGELERLSADIELSKERREALEDSIEALKKDEVTLRIELVQSAKTQKKLSEDISESELRLASLNGRETSARASLNARRGVLAEVLAALQRMGRNPPPALLVSPEDALSSVRSAILLGAVVPEIREQTQQLVDDLKELTDIRASIANERELLLATLENQAEEEERLTLLLAEKRKLTEQSQEKLALEAEASQRLAARAKSLEDLIASLGTEIDSVRKAAAEARLAEKRREEEAKEQRQKAREQAREGTPDANRIAPAFAFSKLKKKLELPVAGSQKFGFGEDDGSGQTLQGMTVSTVADAIVTAPADGWVVYSGPFRSYGELIILNAGDGYHLVLAGMGRTNADIGQFVVAGEPIGRMTRTKVVSASVLALASTEPTLYIEFRKNGKPVDPAPWWASNPSGRVRNDS